MPLFTVMALWAAYEVVVARRARWAVLFFVALAAQVQIRILALIFGPAALLTVVLWPWSWGIRWPAVGIALGALMTVPYLAWVGLNWDDFTAKLAEGNRGVADVPHHGAAELVLWVGSRLRPAAGHQRRGILAGAAWDGRQGALGLVGLLLVAGCVMAVSQPCVVLRLGASAAAGALAAAAGCGAGRAVLVGLPALSGRPVPGDLPGAGAANRVAARAPQAAAGGAGRGGRSGCWAPTGSPRRRWSTA